MQETKSVEQILSHGKLPYSSYYDIYGAQQDATSNNATSSTTQTGHNQSPQHAHNEANAIGVFNENLEIWSCAFSPGFTHLAWGCGYGIIKIMNWKLRNSLMTLPSTIQQIVKPSTSMPKRQDSTSGLNNSSEVMMEIDCGEPVCSLAFGSSSKQTCTAATGEFKPPSREFYKRFDFDRHHLILAAGLASGKIRLYDIDAGGKFLFGLFDHSAPIRDLQFTMDGSLQLASASRDTTIKLWNMHEDGNMYKTLRGHTGIVHSVVWSPSCLRSRMLCSGGANRQAFIWDASTSKLNIIHTLRNAHMHDVVKVQFSPDGSLVATASLDTKICLWDPYTGQLVKQLFHLLPAPSLVFAGGFNTHHVRSLAFSSNGDHIVSICDDKKIRVWSLCGRRGLPISEGEHRDGISCVYDSSSGLAVVGTRSGHLTIHQVPRVIPKLVYLCRKVVNQMTSLKTGFDRENIQRDMCLPYELKMFLAYEDIKDSPTSSTPNKNFTTSSPQFSCSIHCNPSKTIIAH